MTEGTELRKVAVAFEVSFALTVKGGTEGDQVSLEASFHETAREAAARACAVALEAIRETAARGGAEVVERSVSVVFEMEQVDDEGEGVDPPWR